MKRLRKILNYSLFPIGLVIVWYIVSENQVVPSILLPRLSSIGEAFLSQLSSGRLQQDILVSLGRIGKGYSLGIVIGITLGVSMGMSKRIYRFFIFTVTAIRQIPMLAWIPLLVMWFGIGEKSKIAVILLASYFPIMVNTLSGIKRTDPKLIEVGQMYHLSKWKLFTQIYLPSAIPSIFIGLKLGLSQSWMALVGAELIAATAGIGYRISDARIMLQTPVVFSAMLTIAILGLSMDFALSILARICTPWEKERRTERYGADRKHKRTM